jgi:transposase-like protein
MGGLCIISNGISINYIAEAIGRPYRSTYYMIRDVMDRIRSLQEKVLSGECETDELYVRAGSKGVPLETNGEERTLPSRRGLPRGPGRGTFEKNTPMVTIYHQRAAKDDHDWTIFDVPRDGRSLVEGVEKRIRSGSTVMTDEHPGYKKLGEAGYGHHTVNHSEGEYAAGDNNEIHTNNCECRVGLLKWWQKKHRGISKWHLESYVKAFQFTHNHRHYSIQGRFMVTLEALL